MQRGIAAGGTRRRGKPKISPVPNRIVRRVVLGNSGKQRRQIVFNFERREFFVHKLEKTARVRRKIFVEKGIALCRRKFERRTSKDDALSPRYCKIQRGRQRPARHFQRVYVLFVGFTRRGENTRARARRGRVRRRHLRYRLRLARRSGRYKDLSVCGEVVREQNAVSARREEYHFQFFR